MIRVPLVNSRGIALPVIGVAASGAKRHTDERKGGARDCGKAAVLFLRGMQLRQSQVTGDNPLCPVDPKHLVHGHGTYARCGEDDVLKPTELIPRWLCLPCGHTISVLPDHVLPYRPVSVPRMEAHFDALANDLPEPPATEKQKGCLKRAWHRFTRRLAAFAVVLGQIMQLGQPSAKRTWLELRQLGNLKRILHLLAESFKASLLHDYLCLLPWSADTA